MSEPLTFHGPGWTIRTDGYEVICWAPGPVIHQGQPTGEHRAEWLLSVELGPAPTRSTSPELRLTWQSGGFVAGAALADVLPGLALLDDISRRYVTGVLTAQLDPIPQPAA